MEEVAQRSCQCPIPESIQGQTGWGFQQPGLMETVPAHGRELELDDLPSPSQPKLFFQSVIL